MYDLDDLYQEVVMDHNRRPRNFKKLDEPDRYADGFNPLCGDQIALELRVEDDVITDVGIQAAGCAISKASASMLTEGVKGRTLDEAAKLFGAFRKLVTEGADDDSDYELLGDLEVFAGISKYPARIKCAVLSWHTLNAALNGSAKAVSTE